MTRISRSGRRYGILLGLAVTFVAPPGQAAAPAWVVDELADRVRLSTHTREPVGAASGQPVYGCTEFVFRFDPAVLDRGDLLEIERRIDERVPLLERRG